jgi:peptidyl-prolyl cis-trans isomerase D
MIHMLRKEIKNWNFVWWLVLIAIGGQTLFLRAPRDTKEMRIATVNGQHLTVADLRRAMSQEKLRRELYALYLRVPMNATINPSLVLGNLINQTLLDQQSHQLGVHMSEHSTKEELARGLPDFLFTQEGHINMPAYNEYFRRLGSTVADFEAEQEGNLLRAVVRQAIFESAEVPQWLIQSEYAAKNDSRKYAIATISRDAVAAEIGKKSFTDEELKAFYQQNQEKYRVPEHRKARYVEINKKDFAEKMAISDEEIERYYEKNKANKYKNSAQVSVRQIVINKPVNASADELVAARSRAEAVLAEVQKNPASFADIAKKSSDDSATASKGGSLGFITRGKLSAPVERAAYRLQEDDQISELIDTPKAFYVLQLEKRIKATDKPLSEVRAEVIKSIKVSKAGTKLKSLVQTAARQAKKDPKALDAFAAEHKLSWKETALMSPNDISNAKDGLSGLVRALFARSNKEGTVASLVESDVAMVYHITQVKKTMVPSFDDARDFVKADLIDDLTRKELKKRAQDGHAALLAGEKIDALAHSKGYALKKTEGLTQESAQKVLKDMGEIADKLILLADESQALRYNDGKNYYLAQLVSVEKHANIDSEAAQELRATILEDQKSAYLESFIASLERNAKIVTNETIISSFASR